MGVKRAIKIADGTSRDRTGRVSILNEIVHNEAVVDDFKRRGVGQVLSVDDVSEGTLIISAHGVAPSVIEEARSKGLEVVDATCPLVTRIYRIITKAVKNGLHIIHCGDPRHDETKGIVGYAPESISVVADLDELEALPDWSDRKLGLTVQTTAHMDEFVEAERKALKKWPHIQVFNTICNATTERQSAILELAPKVDMVLVVGSTTSANSKRLVRISEAICVHSALIGSAADIDPAWFDADSSIERVGISAGASTPDFLVEEVISKLVTISGGVAEVVRPSSAVTNRKNAAEGV